MNFSSGDQLRIQEELRTISARAGFPISLGRLLDGWTAFVAQVERGYDDSVYEYCNDLSTRKLLARIEEVLSPDGRKELRSLLDPWDERFRSVTRPSDSLMVAPTERGESSYWFNRIPTRPGPELAVDLGSEDVT